MLKIKTEKTTFGDNKMYYDPCNMCHSVTCSGHVVEITRSKLIDENEETKEYFKQKVISEIMHQATQESYRNPGAARVLLDMATTIEQEDWSLES